MTNRLASIEFSHALIRGGLSPKAMSALFEALPEGTMIVNFAEDYSRAVKHITISNPNFNKVDVGSILPGIVPKFTKNGDHIMCDIDFSSVLPKDYTVQNGRVVQKQSSVQPPTAKELHEAYKDSSIFKIPPGFKVYQEKLNKSINKNYPVKLDTCNHEWKKVLGVNRTYVICKHCEKRDKEQEKNYD